MMSGRFKFTAKDETKKSLVMDKKTALVFGGNGFIGSECVIGLLNMGYEVTCVNRGNWYWDSETRIKPRVKNFTCDRNLGIEKCIEFIDYTLALQKPWNVVLDFTTYDPQVVENTLQILEKYIELYIFISSDSVYEVCEMKKHIGGSKEEDAIRPLSMEKQNELEKFDPYGHGKLACEDVIKELLGEDGIPFVILRLSDVIGPRDTTYRWWVFQLWIQFYHQINKPVLIPPMLHLLETSYVYVKDIPVIIEKIINEKEYVTNEIFNVAFDQHLTLSQLLNDMAMSLLVKQVQIRPSNDQYEILHFPSAPGDFLLPSVTRGPVDNAKIKSRLGWSPTSWFKTLRETTEFYKSAIKYFPTEKQITVDILLENVVPDDLKSIFLYELEDAERGISSTDSPTPENNNTQV